MYTLVGVTTRAPRSGNERTRQLVDVKHRHRRAYAEADGAGGGGGSGGSGGGGGGDDESACGLLRLLIDAASQQTEAPKLLRLPGNRQL